MFEQHMTSMRNCYDDDYYLYKSYALVVAFVSDAIACDCVRTAFVTDLNVACVGEMNWKKCHFKRQPHKYLPLLWLRQPYGTHYG